LAGYAKPGLSVSYGYDGLGRRTSRDVGGTSTGFLFDGLNTVQELTGSTPTANLLTGGVDEVFSRSTGAGSRSLLNDGLGSTLGLADGTSVGAEYTYSPFGATSVSGDDAGNPVRFTGREDDPSGLYYYRSRFYSPTTSRFISTDPLGIGSGDSNPYAYVFNQPTSLVDPMGTKPQGSEDCGTPNSFVAGTRVLMADGSSKPIEQIQLGDRVQAADPETGERAAESVTALIVGDGDKQLVDVTVTGSDGRAATITATDGHPFWIDDDGQQATPGGRWIDAAELRHGQWLKTSGGHLVKITGTHAHQQHTHAYNLTIANLHTYYVLAGDESVLVHNCGGGLDAAGNPCTCGGVKAVVLGEGMDAIKTTARGVGAKWYQAWGKNFAPGAFNLDKSLARNARWLNGKIDDGYVFYDIGIDPGRPNRSAFYALEQQILKDRDIVPIPLARP
jgi:RHS repeat-associated protein